MTSLEEAWRWYESTRHQLQLMSRLGRLHWPVLPWEGPLGRDDSFRLLEGAQVEEEAAVGLAPLADLAVVVLFSVFEAEVRRRVLEQMEGEVKNLKHPALRRAAADVTEQVAEGSFFHVLEPFKGTHADLIEEVNQVRRYRNWVAHGKGGAYPDNVAPEMAYDRLRRFLAVLVEAPPAEGAGP
jgi:hypothetical protein